MRGDAWHASSASEAVDGSRRRLLVMQGLSLLLVAACQSTLPDGVFTCKSDSDCPQQMHCSPESYLCFRILDTSMQMRAVEAAGARAASPGPNAGSGAGAGGTAATPPIAVGSAGASAAAAGSGSPAAGSGGSTPLPGTALCADGELSCAELCVPSDAQNCGSCGHNCRSLPHVSGPVTCSGPGQCGFPSSSCAAGWANCSNDPETGCETDITTPSDCGGCGVKCSATTPVCAAAGCTSGCPARTPNLCDGTCVDNRVSANHCGACGNKCTTSVARAEPVCERGSCGFECNAGFVECNGACVDLKTDAANCGACGMRCGITKACVAGQCACPSGTHECVGLCLRNNSVASCGMKCTPCTTPIMGATPTCDANGECSFECLLRTLCNNSCVDTFSDPQNCGACGKVCDPTQTCALGTCICPSGTHECDRKCVDNASPDTCGSRCTPCTPPSGDGMATCDNSSSCGFRCTTGKLCGTACVDTNTNDAHCGACNMPCTSPLHCMAGSCMAAPDASIPAM